jgi:hypothetical protein
MICVKFGASLVRVSPIALVREGTPATFPSYAKITPTPLLGMVAVMLCGSGDLAGNAWGSDVVGWISFNCNAGGPTQNNICTTSSYKVTFTTTGSPPTPPPPQAITSFYANPTRVRKGGTTTQYYTVASPPALCTITGTNGFSATVSPVDGAQGTIATNVISANTNLDHLRKRLCGGKRWHRADVSGAIIKISRCFHQPLRARV